MSEDELTASAGCELVPERSADGTNIVAAESAPAPRNAPCPVRADERIAAVDVLRGFALLGILAMNIVAFGWPFAGYENPQFSGGADPANEAAWWVNSVLFSGKMMSLFSMLFGAGLVHAYLIWMGDILVMYALCGVALYWFRRRSPRTLILLGILLLMIGSGIGFAFTHYGRFAAGVADKVDADIAAGRQSADWELAMHDAWNTQLRTFLRPGRPDYEKEMQLYRSGYLTIVAGRAPELLMFQVYGFLFFALWGVGGRMLLGMALMKSRVFTAERSWRFYRWMALLAYGFGLPLTVFGAFALQAHGYDMLRVPVAGLAFGLGMVPVSLGHAAMRP